MRGPGPAKRSLGREFRPSRRSPKKRSEPAPLPIDPIPYNRHEHGARFRREPNCNCHPNGEQFILFLMDTSSSIGSSNFDKMKTALSKITALFCNPPRVAAMTFGSDFHLHFCFDCFDTDMNGRAVTSAAIKAIPYRGGSTKTGGAAKCACDELLTQECGMDPDANCIDVVFITDGKSNDPGLEVCEEVKCLHNQHPNGVHTHSIGIGGSINPAELDCIEHSSSVSSVFNFDTFDEFDGAITNIITRLLLQHETYTCANTDDSLGNVNSCIE